MQDDGLIPLDETDLPGSFTPLVVIPDDEPSGQRHPLENVDSQFDPKHREDFVGLLYVGKLEEQCTVAGHRFSLSTPGQTDRLSMGPLHKPYANTVAGEQAWRTIVVAAYLRQIDGELAPEPLRSDGNPVEERFRWVLNSIHSDNVITRIYEETLLLDARVNTLVDILDDLGEASA